MTPFRRLVLKEIRHRWGNFVLSALGVVGAVGVAVAFFTTGESSNRETTRLMRDIGYNLRILPQATDMERFWLTGYSEETLPEDAVQKFMDTRNISYTHLLATLHKRVDWDGAEVILTGIAEEVSPESKKKSPMIFDVGPGEAVLGAIAAERLSVQVDGTIEREGKKFEVKTVLPEKGSTDDVRVWIALAEAQELFNLPGRINEIQALECVCAHPDMDALAMLRDQLAVLLPEAKVVRQESIAEAREQQRFVVARTFSLLLPVVVVVGALWVGVLAMINTRDRRPEIGVLRALGYGTGSITGLFLGRALLIGSVGAVVGFCAGTIVAAVWGPDVFRVTASSIQPDWQLLGWAILVAPALSALAALLPALLATTQDPADILRTD